METMADFVFLGSKIIVDGDSSHEIKRWLLLGRKAMTKLESILKRRDIILPTKVCIVNAICFLVVMYRCKSCTLKKAKHLELMLLNCGAGEDLRVSWKVIRSNQSILKEINPEYSLEGLMLKLQFLDTWCEELIHGKRARCWERLRAGGKGDDRG